jgi:hypothetical protein
MDADLRISQYPEIDGTFLIKIHHIKIDFNTFLNLLGLGLKLGLGLRLGLRLRLGLMLRLWLRLRLELELGLGFRLDQG